MYTLILKQDGVKDVDMFKTRLFGPSENICGCGNIRQAVPRLKGAHEISVRVCNAIEAEFPNVKRGMVHANPSWECTECHTSHNRVCAKISRKARIFS